MFDSHAHCSDTPLFDEHLAVLLRAKEQGIRSILNICTDNRSLEQGLSLQQSYPWVYHAAATPPHTAHLSEKDHLFPLIQQAVLENRLRAIGETGLDYFHTTMNKDAQKAYFIRYLEYAASVSLPIIIHCRDAFDDLFQILDTHYSYNGVCGPAVIHCFTGNQHEADEAIKRGVLISLSGIVTFPKSIALQQIAKEIPPSLLLIETDAPYLAPVPNRGKTNEPAFLLNTATFLSKLRNEPLEQLIQTTSENAKRFLKLPM